MTCKKNNPGNPCCSTVGCTGCCISHIKINLATPNNPADGVSFGSIEWDVVTQPATIKTNELVLGVMKEVCRQTFNCPINLLICDSTYAIAKFPFTNRNITATGTYYYYHSPGSSGDNINFTGTETWIENLYITSAQLTLAKTNTHIKTIITGTAILEYIRFPTPGSVSEHIDDLGTYLYTVNHTTNYTTGICLTPNYPCPCLNSIEEYYPGNLYTGRINGYSPGLDTGWIESNCSSIPVTATTNRIFSEYNSNPTITNRCRIPISKTRIIGGGFTGGDSFNYNYNPWIAYFCKDNLTLTTC